jgi:hypothetical protein
MASPARLKQALQLSEDFSENETSLGGRESPMADRVASSSVLSPQRLQMSALSPSSSALFPARILTLAAQKIFLRL